MNSAAPLTLRFLELALSPVGALVRSSLSGTKGKVVEALADLDAADALANVAIRILRRVKCLQSLDGSCLRVGCMLACRAAMLVVTNPVF